MIRCLGIEGLSRDQASRVADNLLVRLADPEETPENRRSAVTALGVVGARPKRMASYLADADAGVRAAACASVARQATRLRAAHIDAVQVLLERLNYDREADESVRIAAAQALGAVGDTRALPLLQQAASDQEELPEVQQAAHQAANAIRAQNGL